ncbi:MAG TPA: hypothetical protein VM639_11545 [Dongiaceae bacterium]|nr:hypothetical protein [Dongiaceae bacterium]
MNGISRISDAVSMNGLAIIPDELTASIKSWHDGTRRKYLCTLTDVAQHRSWTSGTHDTLEAAVAEAMRCHDIPSVDPGFWRGVRSVLPYAILAWAMVIGIAVLIWRLLA